jgi:hypothetical protein
MESYMISEEENIERAKLLASFKNIATIENHKLDNGFDDGGYIESLVGKLECHEMYKEFSELTTDELLRLLQNIYNDEYSTKRRAVHLCLQGELTNRGIAPYWRSSKKLKYSSNGQYSEAEKRYMNDLQMADLQWVYIQSNGEHQTTSDYAHGGFKDFFESSSFDYYKAEKVASWGWSPEKKVSVIGIGIDTTIQEELSVLRSAKVTAKLRRVKSKSDEVRILLTESAKRNPRRGNKTLNVIPTWIDIWSSYTLGNGHTFRAILVYQIITGRSINESTFRSRIDSIKNTLSDVTNKVDKYF